MTTAVAGGAAALGAGCVLLALFLVVGRASRALGRRRDTVVREAVGPAIAVFAAGFGPAPDVPAGGRARRIFAETCLDVLVELQGSERQRVRELYERVGLLDDAARTLRGRRNVGARRAAADALTVVASPEAASGLRAGLEDRDRLVRATCARGLAGLGDDGALDALADIDTGDAADVLLALAQTRPAALTVAFEAPRLRRVAADVAGALRLLEHAPRLRAALCDRDDEVRAAAARALGEIGDVEAVQPLARLVAAPGLPVRLRCAATEALGRIGDPSSAPALAGALRSGPFAVAAAAAEALARLGPAGRPALVAAAAAAALPAASLARAELPA